MFGYICGGRPVEINVSQVEPSKFLFKVEDASRINHIALFLLPGAQLPIDMAAAVYAQLPGKLDFSLLGALTAAKQSAIFRLDMGSSASAINDVDDMTDEDLTPTSALDSTITFGISIEAVTQVQQYIASQRIAARRPKEITASAPPPPSSDVATLANGIIANAYNFLASFIDPQGKVPIKSFDDWWNKFRSRLSADPEFVKSLQSP